MLTWTSDGSDKRTIVGRGAPQTYLVGRGRRNGQAGYYGASSSLKGSGWPWLELLDGKVPFKLRRDAMAACERHARGEG